MARCATTAHEKSGIMVVADAELRSIRVWCYSPKLKLTPVRPESLIVAPSAEGEHAEETCLLFRTARRLPPICWNPKKEVR